MIPRTSELCVFDAITPSKKADMETEGPVVCCQVLHPTARPLTLTIGGTVSKGRKRLPTQLKIVAGTDRPHRREAKEPKPKIEVPPCPPGISQKAKESWHIAGPLLASMGVLTRVDAMALEMLCEAYADFCEARNKINSMTSVYYTTKNRFGVVHRRHPAVDALNEADRKVRAWLTEFGMTPASRSRVSGNGDGDGINEFFD